MSTGCLSTYRGTTFDMLLHTKVRLLYPSIFDMSTGCLSTYRGTSSDMLLHTKSSILRSFDMSTGCLSTYSGTPLICYCTPKVRLLYPSVYPFARGWGGCLRGGSTGKLNLFRINHCIITEKLVPQVAWAPARIAI
jgi:hypothetical protein